MTIPPNVKYQDKFLKVLKEAKRKKEGVVEMKLKEKKIIVFQFTDHQTIFKE
jgi:hypothetical protein